MSDSRPLDRREASNSASYRAHLLADAKPTEQGILYRRGSDRFLLAWTRVRRALAGVVGDPGTDCTVIFDLAVETAPGESAVYRMDACQGEAARRLARAILLGLGAERCTPCVVSLAEHGEPTLDYPDLASFEAAALESLRFASVL
jgi:hypothetical protein